MKKIHKLLLGIILFIIITVNNLKVYAANNEELNIEAKAALIVETTTGKVIYKKNAKEQNYPASVTKVLTAILVIENCKLDDMATVTKTAVSNIPEGYVTAPLFVDEKISIKDLLYALMLKSANDAAYVLAEHVGGSVEGFSKMMNEKAEEIGCKDSHFVNPNGIHDEQHYTTAYDMFLISKYAMQNETFAKIVSTYKYTLSSTNKYTKEDRVMENTNSFLNPKSAYYNENVKGIKTGTTKQAGNCLITDSQKEGLNFITVVLGAETSDSKFSETKKMIKYVFNNYSLEKINKKDDKIKTIEVKDATKETKMLDLVASEDIDIMKNTKTPDKELIPEIVLNEEISAPINTGDELGYIEYNVDGIKYHAKLLAANDVEKKTYFVEIMIGVGVLVLIVIIIKIVKKRK